MPEFGDNADFAKNQILNARLQNLSTTLTSPGVGQVYFNTTNNLAYYVNNGGTEVAMGGAINAFSNISDGTNTAAASGSDTFKIRSANGLLTVLVTNNDATYGDNVLFTINEASINHNNLTNLASGDVHTQYVLLAGRSGGQTLLGGTGSGDSITIRSTSHATKGAIVLGGSTGSPQLSLNEQANTATSGANWTVNGSMTISTTSTGVTFTLVSTSGAPFSTNATGKVTNLQADVLDGAHASATSTAGTIPIADGSGKIANAYMSGVLAVTDLSTTTTGTGNNVLATSPTIANLTLTAVTGVSMSAGGGRLTGLADPTSAQDAVTKAYVDAIRQGLDVKDSVRAVMTTNTSVAATLATADGVTLNTGDRVLLTGQTTASENGIYTVGASSLTRAVDADATAKVTPGMYTFVEEGTNYDNSGWVLTTNAPITLGTTSLAFSLFSGAGQITAGAGLTKTGNTLDIGAGNGISVAADTVSVSQTLQGIDTLGVTSTQGFLTVTGTTTTNSRSIVGTSNLITITNGNGVSGNPTITVGSNVVVTSGSYADPTWMSSLAGSKVSGNIAGNAANITGTAAIANGGTGQTTKALARGPTGLADTGYRLPQHYEATIGNGSLTTIDVVHNLNTTKPIWNITRVSDGMQILTTGKVYDANTVRLTFSTAPASNALNVAVQG